MLKIDMRKSDWSADGFNGIHGRRPANLFATHSSISRHYRTCSDNLVGTSIFLRLFAVILGRDAQSVPRILLQQGTNLVNKLALLLHKCQLREDSRDKPENDWCWRRLFSVCCNYFKYPSPEAYASTSPSRGEANNAPLFSVIRGRISKVINGLRPVNLKDHRIKSGDDSGWECVASVDDCRVDGTDIKNKTNILFKGWNVVRQYAVLFERRVQSSTRAKKVQVVTRQTNPTGRSMIEMLGVLAIVGVLSVGGIAGYSKAMTKWKINKSIEQIEQITNGIFTAFANQKDIGFISTFRENDRNLFKSLGIISEDMIVAGELKNPFGGKLQIFSATSASYYKANSGEKHVALEYWNIPREACMALGSLDWAKGSDTVIGVGISPNGDDPLVDSSDCWLDNSLTLDYGDWLVVCSGGAPDEESGQTEADRIPLPIPFDIVAEHCNCKDNDCYFSVAFTDR